MPPAPRRRSSRIVVGADQALLERQAEDERLERRARRTFDLQVVDRPGVVLGEEVGRAERRQHLPAFLVDHQQGPVAGAARPPLLHLLGEQPGRLALEVEVDGQVDHWISGQLRHLAAAQHPLEAQHQVHGVGRPGAARRYADVQDLGVGHLPLFCGQLAALLEDLAVAAGRGRSARALPRGIVGIHPRWATAGSPPGRRSPPRRDLRPACRGSAGRRR